MKLIFFLVLYAAILLLLTRTMPYIHAQKIPSSFYTSSHLSVNPLTPTGSPLPGAFQITAYFQDPSYYAQFHKQHTGIDLVPTTDWQTNHPGDTILTTTIAGIATHYHETCSGDAVLIRNDSYIEYLGHIARYLVQNNTSVEQGQPVAIMGSSGEAACVTGPHVHYQLYKKEGSAFQLVNPLPYLSIQDKNE